MFDASDLAPLAANPGSFWRDQIVSGTELAPLSRPSAETQD